MNIDTVGWDIGGAHLKAVALHADGQIIQVTQLPCPLWQGLNRLREALLDMSRTIPLAQVRRHAVTMTGELADCFPDRRTGVRELIRAACDWIGPEALFFSGQAGLMGAHRIQTTDLDWIGSANWLASAQWAARRCPHALLIDIGSTTTDLTLLMNGEVRARGYTDHERLRYDELVYHGVVRTPVMTIAECAPFEGEWVTLMNEQFATAADVYRLTGELPDHADQHPAADGGGTGASCSIQRLARMIGRDSDSAARQRWVGLAHYFRERQLQRLSSAVSRQISRADDGRSMDLVGAGVGRYLIRDIARRLQLRYRDAAHWLRGETSHALFDAADCLPAAAVAELGRTWR